MRNSPSGNDGPSGNETMRGKVASWRLSWHESWRLLTKNKMSFHMSQQYMFPGGIPSCPMAVHPVCPDCPSLGNARRDLAELHLEDSSSWRCPPGCQHCFNMGRPTHLIPRTPLVIGPPMRTPLVSDVRPSPASCKVLNQKFTKHRSWSKWQRDYERQGGTWPYSSPKWQDLSLGG